MDKSHQSIFITLEGIDGCGKTTLLTPLSFWLSDFLSKHVVTTREPYYGFPDPEVFSNPEDEYVYYMNDRYNHVRNVILPALKKGHVVLCDRYYDSTYAYQIVGKNAVSREKFAADMRRYRFREPDYTILLDLPVVEAVKRQSLRDGTEQTPEEICLLDKASTGYKLRAEQEFQNPIYNRFITVNASLDAKAVFDSIKEVLTRKLTEDGFVCQSTA